MDRALPPLTADALERLQIFRGVDPDLVFPLLGECAVRAVDAGEVLIRAGEPNRHLYLLLEGRLSIRVGGDGREEVAALEAGESVGEISLIDRRPASAFVVAAAPSRLLVLDEALMWRLAQLSHAVSVNLLGVLAGRLRYGNDVIERDRARLSEARHLASVDALTGLYNRHWLATMLPRQMDRSRRGGEPLSVLMADVDDFKRYNDTHGHLAGDCALHAVAVAIRAHLRPADLAVRFGGEEFLVLLPGAALEEARGAAERLCAGVASSEVHHLRGHPLPHVTLSAGVAQMLPGELPEPLIQRADGALYRAKQGGRNRVCT